MTKYLVGEVNQITVRPVPQGTKLDVLGVVAGEGSPIVSLYTMLGVEHLRTLKDQVDNALFEQERKQRANR